MLSQAMNCMGCFTCVYDNWMTEIGKSVQKMPQVANQTKQQLQWLFQCDLWFYLKQQSPRRPWDIHLCAIHSTWPKFIFQYLQIPWIR